VFPGFCRRPGAVFVNRRGRSLFEVRNTANRIASEFPPGVPIRWAISSATSAEAWATSPELRERLLSTVRAARVPIFFFQAANDYDLAPTERLSSEMERTGKPFVRKIYPVFGKTNADGHSFGYFGGTQ
jgi:hypothetical protein